MKNMLPSLLAGTLLASSIPTSSAATLMRGDCSTFIGPVRNRCLRRQDRQEKPVDAKKWRMKNNNLIRERRLMRRADIGGRSGTKKSEETLRREHIEKLRNRRMQTLNTLQHRYDERSERREEMRKQRMEKLRFRYHESRQNAAGDRAKLRSRVRRLHDRSQSRSKAIKRAHEACRTRSMSDRLECLRRARQRTLEGE